MKKGKKIRDASAFCKSTPRKECILVQNKTPVSQFFELSLLKTNLRE